MLNKTESEKVIKWQKSDVAANISVYIINTLIIAALFLLCGYVNGLTGGKTVFDVVADYKRVIQFAVFLITVISLLAVYIYFEDRNFMHNASNSEMFFLVIEFTVLVCFFVGRFFNVYFRPIALSSLIILFLSNRRYAIFISAITCIVTFLFDTYLGVIAQGETFILFIVGFSSCVISSFVMAKIYSRFKLLTLSFLISLPAVLGALTVLVENGFTDWITCIVSAVFSGVLSAMLLTVALPVFEFIFRKVSCFKLAEFNDHKSKLIRRLIKEAPGTFNHSLVVANIAEACATAIEEDGLLARTCAYYHDIGKLRRPEFFSENQAEGFNPHTDLTPELSATIIRSHAADGYNLLLKNGYPKEIADVAVQHHGTMPILYFYDKAKKFTDGEVDISQYSYAGPKPQSKIAAIIMIADGCEAAVRTLKERSREKVSDLVRKIVNDRMELGQFDECEITIKEIGIIIETVVNNLTGIYHKRVKYPKVSLNGIKETGKEENE